MPAAYGPLRGRDDELDRALRVVRRTYDHRASGVVLVSGDPGIGKTAVLAEIADLIASSAVDFDVAATYPLDRVADAYKELEQRHTHGKIVLRP